MINKKKIIFFMPTMEFGGAERVVSILLDYLADIYEVELLLYYNRKIQYFIRSNVKITYIKEESGSNNVFKNIKWIRNYLINTNSIIISFLTKFNILMLLALRNTNIPIIISNRSDPKYDPSIFLYKILRRILYKKSSLLIVQTNSAKEYYAKYKKILLKIIPNPISDKILLVKKKHNNESNPKIIISVGRLVKSKNHKGTIKAFKKLSYEYSNYDLHIYGDGPQKKKLQKYIIKNGLENRVYLKGSTSFIFEKMKNSYMFILNSNYEGMPNALFEAMSLGIPVISTKVNGAKDYIINEKNGILINFKDSRTLYYSMKRVIENKSLRDELIKNTQKTYELLEEKTIIKKWLKVIKEVES